MTAETPASDLVKDFNAAYEALTAPGAPFASSAREVRGVPVRVFDSAMENMLTVWEMASQHGDKDYLVYGDERYSYADAQTRVRALAHYLRTEHGAGPGTRVAVSHAQLPRVGAGPLGHHLATGAAVVGMNAWWTRAEMEFALPRLRAGGADRRRRAVGAARIRSQRGSAHRHPPRRRPAGRHAALGHR